MHQIKSLTDGTYVNAETGLAVSVADLTALVRGGETFQIVEPAQEKDVTQQVLAEIFVKEGFDTKQAFFKRYVLDGLSKETVKVEGWAKKVLLVGIGATETVMQQLQTLASKGEASDTTFAKALKEGFAKLEAAPKQFEAKVSGLFTSNTRMTEIKDNVRALTESVTQVNGHKERAAKKPASV